MCVGRVGSEVGVGRVGIEWGLVRVCWGYVCGEGGE